MPLEVPIVEVEPQSAHLRIAAAVRSLRELGMSRAAIARRLGVCRKTVAGALAWIEEEGVACLESGRLR